VREGHERQRETDTEGQTQSEGMSAWRMCVCVYYYYYYYYSCCCSRSSRCSTVGSKASATVVAATASSATVVVAASAIGGSPCTTSHPRFRESKKYEIF
jgi:hypothetical protein